MTWVPVLPALALAVALVTLPGLVVGAALGLRRIAWLGSAPMLSLAVLGVAIPLSGVLGMRWTPLPIVVSTLLLAAGSFLAWWLARRFWPWSTAVDEDLRRSRWWVDVLVACGVVGLGCLWGAAVTIHTIGDVRSVQQSFDTVFHVNAIERVAELGQVSPGTVMGTQKYAGPVGFYPPAFHALGSLLVTVTGATPVEATNVLAVVMASVMWLLSCLTLVHLLLPRSRFALLAASLTGVTMPVFPYLLMYFGVLWPNLLSMVVLPAVLACIVTVLRQGPARVLPWAGALGAGLLSVIGLYYAHPGGAFGAIALALPVAATAVVRALGRVWTGRRLGPLWAILAGAVIWFGVQRLWEWVIHLPALKEVTSFDWPATMTMAQAFGNAMALGTSLSPSSWWLAALVVLGAIQACRQPTLRWVVLAHAMVVYLYMLSIGTDEAISQELTGLWYNDSFRIAALLGITAVPLMALGLTWCRDQIRYALDAWLRGRPERPGSHLDAGWAGTAASRAVCGLLVLAALVAVLPGQLMLLDVQTTLKRGYYPVDPAKWIVDPPEAELYADALRPRRPDDHAQVIGNPWNGAALAGPIAGRPSTITHLINVLDPDRTLLRERFRDLATDPAVCRAIRRLDVRYATEDTRLLWPDDDQRRPYTYPGLDHLEGRPGLTPIAREGTVTVYQVTGCGLGPAG